MQESAISKLFVADRFKHLNQAFLDLLSSSLSLSLVLELTSGEYAGEVDIEGLANLSDFSFLRHCPDLQTIAVQLLRQAETAKTQFFTTVPKAFAATCAQNNNSPLKVTQVARLYQNQSRTHASLVIKVAELLKEFRAQCLSSNAHNHARCLAYIEEVAQLREQSLISNTDLTPMCNTLYEQFFELAQTLNDETVLTHYSQTLSELIAQHYQTLTLALVEWESSEQRANGRNDLFILLSKVNLLNNIFGNHSLQPFSHFVKVQAYADIISRRQLEFRWRDICINLQSKISQTTTELMQGYLDKIDDAYHKALGYASHLVIAVGNNEQIDPELLNHYDLLCELNCYLDIVLRYHATPARKTLLFSNNEQANHALQRQLPETFSEGQVNFLRVAVKILAALYDSSRIPLAELPDIRATDDLYDIQLMGFYTNKTPICEFVRDLRHLENSLAQVEIHADNPALQQLKNLILSSVGHRRKVYQNYICDLLQKVVNRYAAFDNRLSRMCKDVADKHRHYENAYQQAFKGKLHDKFMHYIPLINQLTLWFERLTHMSDFSVAVQECQIPVMMDDNVLAIFQAKIASSKATVATQLHNSVGALRNECEFWLQGLNAAYSLQPSSLAELIKYTEQLQILQQQHAVFLEQIANINDPEIKISFQFLQTILQSLTPEKTKLRLDELAQNSLIDNFCQSIAKEVDSIAGEIIKVPGAVRFLIRYICLLNGNKDPQLSVDLQTAFAAFDALSERLKNQQMQINLHGPLLEQIVGDKWRFVFKLIAELLSNLEELKANHNSILSLVVRDTLSMPVLNVAQAPMQELKECLIEIVAAVKQGNSTLRDFGRSLGQPTAEAANYDSDIAILIEKLSLKDGYSQMLKQWLLNLNVSMNQIQTVQKNIEQFCQRIKSKSEQFEEYLDDVLDEVVLVTFVQVSNALAKSFKFHETYIELIKQKLAQGSNQEIDKENQAKYYCGI